jgi:NADPH:quinone reductase-like Zn-dependent oxidoreductase
MGIARGIGRQDAHSMKANRIHRFGPPEVITFEDVERPVPGEGEVLVRVKAAGVGPWDAWIRAGKSVLPHSLPLTLGSDLSGVVENLGPGAKGLDRGEAIFGVTNKQSTGAYAEYAVASGGMIAAKPRRLDHVEAAAVPIVAVTAWQMLFEHARVAAGQSVLVHGAGGSVGACAVQLARRAGARVIATASADDAEYVHDLGADQVVDFRAVRFEDVTGPVNAVIDTVGGSVQQRSFDVLEPGGVLVSAVSRPDPAAAVQRGVRALFMLVETTTTALTRLAPLLDAGELAVRVGTVMPLAEGREAHEMLEGMRVRSRGKIVLGVDL